MALLKYSRELRRFQTEAEKKLWARIRDRKLLNLKFRRQHELNENYILDFYCPEIKLCIEVDGKIHDSLKEEDENRDRVLDEQRITVLRIKNEEIFSDIEKVIKKIKSLVKTLP